MRSKLVAWVPVALWLFVIAGESTERMGSAHTILFLQNLLSAMHVHVSWAALQTLNHLLRKAGHLLGYGLLGVLFVRAWGITLRGAGRPVYLAFCLGLASTVLVATADELHQRLLPGRTASAYDVILDAAGACICVYACKRWLERSQGEM